MIFISFDSTVSDIAENLEGVCQMLFSRLQKRKTSLDFTKKKDLGRTPFDVGLTQY